MTTNGAGDTGAPIKRTLRLAGREVTVEPPSGRKASRAFALLRAISNQAPELVEEWGRFELEYSATHYRELDRAYATLRYGPEPLVVEGEVVRYPDGHDRAGELILIPGALESMTDEAWASVDNKLRLPEAPGLETKLLNIIRHPAIEAAEANVYRLLALFAMPNADVKRYRKDGSLPERLDDLADELLDEADLGDLIELAVIAGEVIDDQFRRKAEALGSGRLGNALRVLGMDPTTLTTQTAAAAPQTAQMAEAEEETKTTDGSATSTPTPPSSSSTSSGDGPTDSGGTPTPSSTPTGEPSPALATASSASG